MIIIVLMLLAVSAFLSGFLYGTMRVPKDRGQGVRDNGLEMKSSTNNEYENFLKYDGSEQF